MQAATLEIVALHAACEFAETLQQLQVPPEASAKQLCVSLEPFRIRVADKCSSEVYLEGILERGIVPKESTWTLGGGPGEDGCLLLLHKMNLELLQKYVLPGFAFYCCLCEECS